VIGIAAVAIDAERVRLTTHMFSSPPTQVFALAATEPGIDQRDVGGHFRSPLVGGRDIGPEGL